MSSARQGARGPARGSRMLAFLVHSVGLMLTRRHALAQLALLATSVALLSACGASHPLEPGDGAAPDLVSADGGSLDGGSLDAGVDEGVIDAGPRNPCDAQDAHEAACPVSLCDGPDGWYWNGDRCFSITCGGCEGTACAARFASEGECAMAHTACEPSLCRGSGGDWLFWAQECLHYQCGHSVPADCAFGRPVCDCGPLRTFDPTVGCVADPSCAVGPPIPPRELLCTGSGGSWEGICCDTVCGDFCPLACATPACNCGAGRVFDDARGCIESTRCFERSVGETCDPRARCASGSLCCQTCGGAGCFGAATCRAPTCSPDPAIDTCGNNRFAP